MNTTTLFVPIVKVEKQADGTLLVKGPVSTDALDRDQQICDADWLDRAVPQWFGESGNVREMHTTIAAGKAVSYWKGETQDHWIEALVVDPSSVLKVEHEVLKGFSVGIKNARVVKDAAAPNGRIVDGSIIEVSLVDRPANPECLLTLAKSDDLGVMLPVEQSLIEATYEETEPVEVVLDLSGEPAVRPHAAAPMVEAAVEIRARANDVLAALSGMGLSTGKADEAADISEARNAIAAIGRLIEAEARSLAAGMLDEAYDIRLLLEAVDALRWFIAAEQNEALVMADEPEVTKEDDTPPPAPVVPPEETAATMVPVETKTQAADVEPVGLSTEQVQALIDAAMTKVEETHKAETSALRDELAEVKARPIPGGPVRVRTQIEKALATDHDRTLLLAQASEYDAKAEQVGDRTVAEGYRSLAAQMREKATR